MKPKIIKWILALKLTALGNSAKQVAFIMGISQDAVVKHLLRAREKLSAKTTAEAIYKACKTGLICFLIIANASESLENVVRVNRSRGVRVVRVARRARQEKMI